MAKKKDKKAKAASPDAESDATEGSGKSGSSLIFQIIMVLVVGAASFAAVFLLPRDEPASTEHGSEHGSEHADAEPELDLAPDTTFLELTPLTLSLSDNRRTLKIGITLEVISGEEGYIDPDDPKIRDAFMGYLRSLRTEQLEDAAFMAQMRAQLLRRAEVILGPGKIHGILITDFLVR